MIVKGQDALICTNPQCRTEFVVVKKATLREMNPRCYCGSEMKHAYHSPVLRVLNERERIEIETICSLHRYSSSLKTI